MNGRSPRTIEPLLTIPEVAAICRVSTKTIRRRIEDKDLVARRIGVQWRITREDLDRFIRADGTQ